MKQQPIPAALYRKILGAVPVLTVDVIIVHRKKFLLVKRAQLPAKGMWWTPGGRVVWGENMEAAVRRKARSETGLSVRVDKLLGIANFKFRTSAWGIPTHTPSAFYLARPVSLRPAIKLDKTSTNARWFSRIPKRSYPELSRMLRQAGFK